MAKSATAHTPSSARRLTLPSFTITETCPKSDSSAKVRKIGIGGASAKYLLKPIAPASSPIQVHSFSIVVNEDGSPWKNACLYLMWRLEGNAGYLNAQTLSSIAGDLADYRRFLDSEDIDYKVIPRRKYGKPIYRYRGHLILLIQAGKLAASTARRRMQSVMGFYRWLSTETRWTPAHSLWNEKEVFVSFVGDSGNKISQKKATTDVGISVNRESNPFDESIVDEQRLKPLSIDEQRALISALQKLGNPEMLLMHYVMLFTGARLQTALTLRASQFSALQTPGQMEIPISCGPGTGIDTKHQKQITLFFPIWLYELLQTYSESSRAKCRRQRLTSKVPVEPYFFVSSHGNPYYSSQQDIAALNESTKRRYQPIGVAVRVFISDRILPVMRDDLGQTFRYRPHDLRATYGMNLTDCQLRLVELDQVSLHEAREFVRVRMSHERTETTDRYLTYRQNIRVKKSVQQEYEAFLESLIDTTKNPIEHLV